MRSAHTLEQCPQDTGREVAIAGQSNAGKSSVINVLANKRNLARTGKSPGRTQLLNFFLVAAGYRLVDLPGYGFARVPVDVKHHWSTVVQSYLDSRQSLAGLILVMDVRHPLKPYDEQMISWCRSTGLPVHIVLNKADKLSHGTGRKALDEVRRRCCGTDDRVTAQLLSTLKHTGIDSVKDKLRYWFNRTNQHT